MVSPPPARRAAKSDSVHCLARGTVNKSQLNKVYLDIAGENGKSIVVGGQTAAALRTLYPDQSTTLVRLQGLAGQSPASPKSIRIVLGIPRADIGASGHHRARRPSRHVYVDRFIVENPRLTFLT